MSDKERHELRTAILTICDPRGNWQYGWNMLCSLAGLDPKAHPAPFQTRTDDELREMGTARLDPPISRVQPPKEV